MGLASRRKGHQREDAATRGRAQYKLAQILATDADTAHEALDVVLRALERGEPMTPDRIIHVRGVLATLRTHLDTARTHLATWKATLPPTH